MGYWGNWMKWRKFIIFAIAILSVSVVVFNNLTQVARDIFIPQFNVKIWSAFAVITLVVIAYAVINKDMLK